MFSSESNWCKCFSTNNSRFCNSIFHYVVLFWLVHWIYEFECDILIINSLKVMIYFYLHFIFCKGNIQNVVCFFFTLGDCVLSIYINFSKKKPGSISRKNVGRVLSSPCGLPFNSIFPVLVQLSFPIFYR